MLSVLLLRLQTLPFAVDICAGVDDNITRGFVVYVNHGAGVVVGVDVVVDIHVVVGVHVFVVVVAVVVCWRLCCGL